MILQRNGAPAPAWRRRLVGVGLLLTMTLLLVGSDRAGARAESDDPPIDTLTLPKAIVLGIVEGVTEYLPISSTGHLLITERILDVGQISSGPDADEDVTDTFTVVIQLGAILAVLGIYRGRFTSMLAGVAGRSSEGRSVLVSLLVAFVPAAVIGKVFGDPIKEHLLAPWPVIGAWVVGALVIFVAVANQHRFRGTIASMGAIDVRTSLLIGVAQVFALWPGSSRSLVTILAALALGLTMEVAVEFSFLLGFITLSAATSYELYADGAAMFDRFGVINPLVGTVVAGVAAFASVKWMVGYLQRHPLTIFGVYRLGAAAIAALLLSTNSI